jgi:hypothetical protein
MASHLLLAGPANAGVAAAFDPTLYGTVYGRICPAIQPMWQNAPRTTLAQNDGDPLSARSRMLPRRTCPPSAPASRR